MTKKPDGSWDKSKLPSRHVTEGPSRAPHRSYYYAMGLGTREINQPFVGVASCWNEAAPCNTALMRQAHAVSAGVKNAGATPREFCTITVTGGIAMGLARRPGPRRPLRAGGGGLPRRRLLRRPIHRQHHGLRLRGDRAGPTALGRASGALRKPRPVRRGFRRGGGAADREEPPPARHLPPRRL